MNIRGQLNGLRPEIRIQITVRNINLCHPELLVGRFLPEQRITHLRHLGTVKMRSYDVNVLQRRRIIENLVVNTLVVAEGLRRHYAAVDILGIVLGKVVNLICRPAAPLR